MGYPFWGRSAVLARKIKRRRYGINRGSKKVLLFSPVRE
jgi:hypothetical protein